jgi:hypothetical protein
MTVLSRSSRVSQAIGMPLLFPQVARFRRQATLATFAMEIASLVGLVILSPMSAKAVAQGFPVWGTPLGVPPSFPFPIGVYPGHPLVGIPPAPFYGPHFPGGYSHAFPQRDGFRDYRHEYNLRMAEAYRIQMQIAAAYSGNPMPQAEIERYLRSSAYPSNGDFGPGFNAMPDWNAAIGSPRPFGGEALRPDAWPQNFDDPIGPVAVPPRDVTLRQMTDSLRQSASRLDAALNRRGDDGQVWRDYLRLETILAAVSHPNTEVGSDVAAELARAVNHFDGVVAAGDLRHIMRADGFSETRFWLKRLVDTLAAENAATGTPHEDSDDAQAKSPPQKESSRDPVPENLPPPIAVPR